MATNFRLLNPKNEYEFEINFRDWMGRCECGNWYWHISIPENVSTAAQQSSDDRHVSPRKVVYIWWCHSIDSRHHFRLNIQLNRQVHFGTICEN